MRLGPSMCQQCATLQNVPSANSVSTGLCKLCVNRALNEYVSRSGNYRHEGTTQLFIAYGRQVRGKPICKQRLSNWLVECIKFAYKNTTSQ